MGVRWRQRHFKSVYLSTTRDQGRVWHKFRDLQCRHTSEFSKVELVSFRERTVRIIPAKPFVITNCLKYRRLVWDRFGFCPSPRTLFFSLHFRLITALAYNFAPHWLLQVLYTIILARKHQGNDMCKTQIQHSVQLTIGIFLPNDLSLHRQTILPPPKPTGGWLSWFFVFVLKGKKPVGNLTFGLHGAWWTLQSFDTTPTNICNGTCWFVWWVWHYAFATERVGGTSFDKNLAVRIKYCKFDTKKCSIEFPLLHRGHLLLFFRENFPGNTTYIGRWRGRGGWCVWVNWTVWTKTRGGLKICPPSRNIEGN